MWFLKLPLIKIQLIMIYRTSKGYFKNHINFWSPKEDTSLPYSITISHPYPISEFIEYSNNKMHVIGDGKLIFAANSKLVVDYLHPFPFLLKLPRAIIK
jgi:hypothetical protein